MKVWEENKCHSESLCSEKQCFRDCPFLTFYWRVAFICKGNCLFWIFLNFTFSTILHTIQSISWVQLSGFWRMLSYMASKKQDIEDVSHPQKSSHSHSVCSPSPWTVLVTCVCLCHAHPVCCPAWHRGASYDVCVGSLPLTVAKCLWWLHASHSLSWSRLHLPLRGICEQQGLGLQALPSTHMQIFFSLRFMRTWKTPAGETHNP